MEKDRAAQEKKTRKGERVLLGWAHCLFISMRTRSSVGLERQTTNLKVGGSIPLESAIYRVDKGMKFKDNLEGRRVEGLDYA